MSLARQAARARLLNKPLTEVPLIKGTEVLFCYVIPILMGIGIGLASLASLCKLAVMILLGAG